MDGLRLTAAQQRLLPETLRRTHDARVYKRTLAVLECGRGRSKAEVARSLSVTRQSVHNWVCHYCCSGRPAALDDAPKSGRPKADNAVEALVKALMMVSPECRGYHATHRTIPLLCDQVRRNLARQCSQMTLRRCLHRLGYAWKRPRYVLAPDRARLVPAAAHARDGRRPAARPLQLARG